MPLLLSKIKMYNGTFYILKKSLIQIELIWNANEEWEKQSQRPIYPGLCLFFHYLADPSLILICSWARDMQFWQSCTSSLQVTFHIRVFLLCMLEWLQVQHKSCLPFKILKVLLMPFRIWKVLWTLTWLKG